MQRVLIYHKQMTSFLSGGMFQPLMFIAELQKTCEVTLALNGESDMKAVSEMSGIPIDVGRLRVVRLDTYNSFVAKREWLAYIFRVHKLRSLAKDADVCISTANIVDFGKPGHHFVYLLSQFGGAAFYDYLMGRGGGFGARRIMRRISTAFYENVVKPICGVRPLRRIMSDGRERIYPTSAYVEGILRGYFGSFNSKVFYPPTTFEFNDASVVRDPLLAIYVGRIFPPKRITDIIAIVERARALSGKDLKLHIAGKLMEIPYTDLLRRMAAERPWLKLVGAVYGKDKERFMLSATYALHAERDEAFGIAIAEYLKAGCIPLVPDVGGPKEVVGSSALEFHDNDTAAQTLSRLLSDESFREEQRLLCNRSGENFTLRAYQGRQSETIGEMLRQ